MKNKGMEIVVDGITIQHDAENNKLTLHANEFLFDFIYLDSGVEAVVNKLREIFSYNVSMGIWWIFSNNLKTKNENEK